jgi:hypothetical protein
MIRSSQFEREVLEAADPALIEVFEAGWSFLAAAQLAIDALLPRSNPRLSDFLKTVLLAIGFDCFKKFRAILGVCEIGHDDNAEILTRSLFETMLAERFILKPWPRKYNLPKPVGRHPPRDFRGLLYLSAPAIKCEKLLDRIQKTPGAKRTVPKSRAAAIRNTARDCEAVIGSAWAAKIRARNAFSGLNIWDLAQHTGFKREYATLYGLQSFSTHGGTALNHIEATESRVDLKRIPDFAKCAERIGIAGSYLATVLCDIGKALEVGTEIITRGPYERLSRKVIEATREKQSKRP